MKPDLTVSRHEFYVLIVEEPEDFTLFFKRTPYPCLIWAGRSTSAAFKADLVRRLIQSNCRYVVCAGTECQAWETAADEAFVNSDADFNPPDERHVMTTAHEGESPDEVAFFFVNLTNFDDHDFRRYAVMFIGADESTRREVMARIEHYAKVAI